MQNASNIPRSIHLYGGFIWTMFGFSYEGVRDKDEIAILLSD